MDATHTFIDEIGNWDEIVDAEVITSAISRLNVQTDSNEIEQLTVLRNLATARKVESLNDAKGILRSLLSSDKAAVTTVVRKIGAFEEVINSMFLGSLVLRQIFQSKNGLLELAYQIDQERSGLGQAVTTKINTFFESMMKNLAIYSDAFLPNMTPLYIGFCLYIVVNAIYNVSMYGVISPGTTLYLMAVLIIVLGTAYVIYREAKQRKLLQAAVKSGG